MQDFHFVMNINKASPKLFEKCATGEHIANAVLTARKAGKDQLDYMTIKFSDLLVSSYQNSGSAGANSLPTDSISLNFAKIEYEYKPQDSKGALGSAMKMKYDLKQMKAG
jgi:type VI secretion system secreted protein Hcp